MNPAECPNCGMTKTKWSGRGQGYSAEGEVYCCRGCAEGGDCTCPGQQAPATLIEEEAVGEAQERNGGLGEELEMTSAGEGEEDDEDDEGEEDDEEQDEEDEEEEEEKGEAGRGAGPRKVRRRVTTGNRSGGGSAPRGTVKTGKATSKTRTPTKRRARRKTGGNR